MSIMCFKDRKHCSWFIFDETNNLIPVPFGMIVYGYVANVLRMTDNGEIVAIYDDNLYDDILSNCFSKSEMQNTIKTGLKGYISKGANLNAESYKKHALILKCFLDELSKDPDSKTNEEKMEKYKMFRYFGVNTINGDFFDEDVDYIKSGIYNVEYHGICQLSGRTCEVYLVESEDILFTLDLEAFIFDRNKKSNPIYIKICDYCSRVYWSKNKNQKRCDYCRKNYEIKKEIHNKRVSGNQLYKTVSSVAEYLKSSINFSKNDDKTEYLQKCFYDFFDQLDYYKDKLKHKEITPNHKFDMELPDINSEQDIIDWCNRYKDKMKKEVKKWQNN